jgi:hypothetical protein
MLDVQPLIRNDAARRLERASPEKTASLRKTAASSTVSNPWLQSSVAWRVRWRGNAVRLPAVSTLNRLIECIQQLAAADHRRMGRRHLDGQRDPVEPRTYRPDGGTFNRRR